MSRSLFTAWLKEQLVDYIGTDAHRCEGSRVPNICECSNILYKNMMKNMLTPYYMAMQWTELYSKQHIEMRLFIYLRNEEKYRK